MTDIYLHIVARMADYCVPRLVTHWRLRCNWNTGERVRVCVADVLAVPPAQDAFPLAANVAGRHAEREQKRGRVCI